MGSIHFFCAIPWVLRKRRAFFHRQAVLMRKSVDSQRKVVDMLRKR